MLTGLFHPGRQHSWQTAGALAAAGALGWYATAIYDSPGRLPYSAMHRLPGPAGARLRALLGRRSSALIPPDRIRHVGALEWTELALARGGFNRLADRANGIGNRLFQRGVVGLVRREPVARLWGYDTSAKDAFESPEARDMVRVLDQSIAHLAGLRDQLLEVRGKYADLLDASEIPSRQAVGRYTAELAASSHVLVGCDYAAGLATRHGMAADRVHVCSYGYEEANFPPAPREHPGLGALPVRFIFVGSVNARKGIHNLIEVFSRMPSHLATLTVVGPTRIPAAVLQRRLGNIVYRPAVRNDELKQLLLASHCFVFPSLHEGGGIVLYEAAACGLGIIQSANCGDGVRAGPGGANGIVLEDNTPDALRAAVDAVLANPSILRDWSAASWGMREERSWSAYRRRIVELLPKLV